VLLNIILLLGEFKHKWQNKNIRYAPSYTSDDEDHRSGPHPYTGKTIAEFIGWLEPGRKYSPEFGRVLDLEGKTLMNLLES